MSSTPKDHPFSSSASSLPKKPLHATDPSPQVLPRSLPPLSHLFTTAQSSAAAARHSHLLAHSLATALETPLLPPAPPEKAVPVQVVAEERKKGNGSSGARKEGVYEAFEVFRAVEQKDVMLLMEVRDRQFELLLQPTAGGGSTPLVHAMRLGPSRTSSVSKSPSAQLTPVCIRRPRNRDPPHRGYLQARQRSNGRRPPLRYARDEIPPPLYPHEP